MLGAPFFIWDGVARRGQNFFCRTWPGPPGIRAHNPQSAGAIGSRATFVPSSTSRVSICSNRAPWRALRLRQRLPMPWHGDGGCRHVVDTRAAAADRRRSEKLLEAGWQRQRHGGSPSTQASSTWAPGARPGRRPGFASPRPPAPCCPGSHPWRIRPASRSAPAVKRL